MSDDDTRVLNMRINNKDFLKGTSDSLNALNTLNKGIDNAGKGPGLQNMAKGVETVRAKFGALQIAGITAISNITNRAVDAGLKFIKSFTIQPLIDGFSEYNKLLTSTQTVAANTNNNNAKGIAKVGKYLDTLNHYSDLTIYAFGQMADNLGRFTAAGVPLAKATTAIKGLSNAAALAGSTNEQLGTAMYQVSQALSTGVIKLMDWNSLSNAGLGGKNLQYAFEATADSVYHTTKTVDAAKKKFGSFRNSLTAGWLTADIFTKSMKVFAGQSLDATSSVKSLKALGFDKLLISTIRAGKSFTITGKNLENLKKRGLTDVQAGLLATGQTVAYTTKQLVAMGYSIHAAKTLSQLSKDAQDSAQKIKTLSQLLGVVREAIGSGFANVFRQLFGNLEESSKLWTSVGDKIQGAIDGILNSVAIMLNIWHNKKDTVTGLTGYQLAWAALGNVIKTVGNILHPIVQIIKSLFPATNDAGSGMFTLTKAFYNFSVAIEKATSVGGSFYPIIQLLGGAFKIVIGVIGGVIKSFAGFVQILSPIGVALIGLAVAIGGLISKLLLLVHISGGIGGLFDKFLDIRKAVLEPIVNVIVDIIDALTALVNGDMSGFKDKLKDAFSGLTNIGDVLKQGAEIGKNLIAGIASGLNPSAIKQAIGNMVNTMVEFFKGLLGIHSPSTVFEGFGKNIVEGLIKGITGGIHLVISLIKGLVEGIGSGLGGLDRFDLATLFSSIFSAGFFILIYRVLHAFSGFGHNLNQVLSQTTSTLKSMQTAIRAKALQAIAIAVGLLAASLYVLSKIPEEKMKTGLKGMAASLGLLVTAMAIMNKAGGGVTIAATAAGATALAAAMLVLSGAVLAFGNMKPDVLKQGLIGMGIGLGAVTLALAALGAIGPAVLAGGAALVLAANSLVILSAALLAFAGLIVLFSKISKGTIESGLKKIAATLVVLGLAIIPLAAGSPLVLIAAAALLVLGAALVEMLGVIGIFAHTKWGTIWSGVGKIAVALIALGSAGLVAAPGLIALGVAAVLIGAGLLAAGVGMGLFAAGLVAVSTAGAAAGAVLASAFEAFLAVLPVMVVQLVAALVVFIQALAAASPKIVKALVKIGAEILKGAGELVPKIIHFAVQIIEGLIAGLIEAAPKLVVGAADLIVALLNGLTDNIDKIIQAGVNLVVAIITGIGNAAEDLVNAAGTTLLKFLTALDQAINTYEPQILAMGQKIGFDIISGLVTGLVPKPILDAFSTLVHTIVDFFKGLLGINSPSTVFAGFGKNIVQGLANGISNAIHLVTNAISSLLSKIKAGIGNIPGIIKGVVGSVGGAAKSLGSAIISGIKSGLSHIGGALGGIGSAVLDAVKHAINTILPIRIPSFKIPHTPFSFGGKTLIPSLKYARGTDFSGQGAALVGEAGPEVVAMNRGSAVITNKNLVNFMKAVSNLTRSMTKGTSKNSPGGNIVYSVSADFQGDPKSSGVAFAANIAAGLVNGLRANQAKVNATMVNVGTIMSQSFADILGIKSPSTVFKKYAGYVGQGFINGLLASVAGVKKAAGIMAQSAIDTVSKTISSGQLKLESQSAKADAYSAAAALVRAKANAKHLSKAKKKHLEAEAKTLDKKAKVASKIADTTAKKVAAKNAKDERDAEFAKADTAGKASMKNEDAATAANTASAYRQKAIQLAKEADLVRKYDKKRAKELDKKSKIDLGRSKAYADRAAAYAKQASDLDAQAKAEGDSGLGGSATDIAAQILSVSAADVARAQAAVAAYNKSLADAAEAASKDAPPAEVTLNQYNTSPEAISPAEAYRNGKSLVSIAARKLVPTP